MATFVPQSSQAAFRQQMVSQYTKGLAPAPSVTPKSKSSQQQTAPQAQWPQVPTFDQTLQQLADQFLGPAPDIGTSIYQSLYAPQLSPAAAQYQIGNPQQDQMQQLIKALDFNQNLGLSGSNQFSPSPLQQPMFQQSPQQSSQQPTGQAAQSAGSTGWFK